MRCTIKRFVQHKQSINAFVLLFIATLLGAGLNFGAQVVLAHVLSVAQLGAFASSLAMVMLVAPLAGFGVAGYWLKVYGQEGWAAQRWLPASFRFVMISTLLVVAGVLTWAWVGPHDVLTANLLTLLSVAIIGNLAIELGSAKFQLEGNHRGLALWQMLPHALRFAGIALLLHLLGGGRFDALYAASVFAAAAYVLLMLGVWQMSRMVRGEYLLDGHAARTECVSEGKLFVGIPKVRDVISGAWLFGLAGVFYLIYFQSDIILVRYMVGEAEAGLYNVAFVVLSAVYLFPSVLYQKFLLPKLHRWAHQDVTKVAQIYRLGNICMLLLGVAAMLMLWWLTPVLLPYVFGNNYADAVLLLMVLGLAAPFRFLSSVSGAILTTRDNMRTKIRIMYSAAIFNVILNVILIPYFGAIGAAISTVCTEAALCVFLYVKTFNMYKFDCSK